MIPDTSVKIGKLKLKNPVMAASGTFGEEYGEMTDISSLGAVVAKTITLKARSGNPPPRVCETDSGMLNSIGLENKGVEDFISSKLPALSKFRVPVVVSIAGESEEELAELARRLKTVDALEVNLSCPNVKHGAREGLIAQDAGAVAACISAVRKTTNAPIIAKLTPNVTDIVKIAVSAESAGADAVLVANTFFGMAVDIDSKRPKLGNICGGLSGPAIKPMSLKMVWDTARKVKIPVIGCGGIMDYEDAVEFMLCGASAIQVGTANFVAPDTAAEIVKGIAKYMSKNKIADMRKLRGALLV
ncbi:MAG TPA: dihydroorotate dehydrogenase [Candidatus Omnitrophota bacterium]|nr:dihydroorotate dehydrogenase [Candidatus Omnitrophota bacterium]